MRVYTLTVFLKADVYLALAILLRADMYYTLHVTTTGAQQHLFPKLFLTDELLS